MRLNLLTNGSLVLALLGLTACGSSGTQSTTTLTLDQAQAIAVAIGDSMSSLPDNTLTKSLGKLMNNPIPDLAAVNVGSNDVSFTHACHSGNGTITGVGTLTVTEATASSVAATYSISQTASDCEVMSDEGDLFGVAGSITNSGTININSTANTAALSSTVGGAFDVSGTPVTAGTCAIQYSSSFNFAASSVDINATGSICGTSINFNSTVATKPQH